MNEIRPIDPDVAQRRAAEPTNSVWVGASAGTGKTKVLTDRLLRLMLPRRDGSRLIPGSDPGRLLCLTFTKAAAAEMENRLQEKLARWAVMPSPELAEELRALTGRTADDAVLDAARRLFARVVDTPGGLAIRTIHSFAEMLLRRFPLEAGVTPNFAVIDDILSAELLDRARAESLQNAQNAPDSLPGIAYRRLGEVAAGKTIGDLLDEIIAERGRIETGLAGEGGLEPALKALREAEGLPADFSEDGVLAEEIAKGLDETAMREAAVILAGGGKTARAAAAVIERFLDAADPAQQLEQFGAYRGVFLTGKDEPRARLTDKASADAEPAMRAEAERLLHIDDRLSTVRLVQNTAAMLIVADGLLSRYAAAKRQIAALDFDDLIDRAVALLERPGIAPWVLYKLDGGLDHILVDEAQDTSPLQWRIIAALAGDFFAGEGARDAALSPRTIFVVGDEKQSIFGFQGADPRAFHAMRQHFAQRCRDAEAGWDPVDMHISFRSTQTVLDAVDGVFAQPTARHGLTVAERGDIRHRAYRQGMAGRVELWPLVGDAAAETAEAWDLPELVLDGGRAAADRLAGLIADQIADWLTTGERLEARDRAVNAGDILILLRKRAPFLTPLIRALKARDIPVAGADRMVLIEEIGVMDMLSTARFALQPDDDLSLAELLRSPLIDLPEDRLFDLCWKRPRSLWTRLREMAEDDAALAEIRDWLEHRIHDAQWRRPHEFLAALLYAPCPADPVSGRRAMTARLGAECLDPLEALLSLSLDYERQSTASLQGFVRWIEHTGARIKREQDDDNAPPMVRIMTAHGAKGLQAPIVFVPDKINAEPYRSQLIWPEQGDDGLALPYWPAGKANRNRRCETRLAAAAGEEERESRRLLYVALTRAEDRLYVCGIGDEDQVDKFPTSWWALVNEGLRTTAPAPEAIPDSRFDGRRVLRLNDDQRATPKADQATPRRTIAQESEPGWLRRGPPPEPSPARPLTPSRPAHDDPPLLSPLAARPLGPGLTRGRLIHRMLEILPDLPPSERPDAAERLIARMANKLDDSTKASLAAEALAVIDHPELGFVFGPDSRAEVPIAGRIGERVISGRIDRLAIGPDRIVLCDYKSDRPAAENPDHVAPAYLAQMSIYRAALSERYPGRAIECWLVWTESAQVMPLPDDLLRAYGIDSRDAH